MQKLIALSFTALMILGAAGTASAHSGGTNDAGCHAGSKPYHCH
jgi:hypothetical protein